MIREIAGSIGIALALLPMLLFIFVVWVCSQIMGLCLLIVTSRPFQPMTRTAQGLEKWRQGDTPTFSTLDVLVTLGGTLGYLSFLWWLA